MKSFIKKNITMYFLYFISIIVALPIKILYSRILPVEEFGAFFALLSLIIILSPITSLGFSESLNYFIPKYRIQKEKLKKIVNTTITIQLVGSTILFVTTFLLSKNIAIYYLKNESYTNIVQYFSILLLLVPITFTIMNLYRSIEKEEYYLYIDITKNTLILLGSITILLLHKNILNNFIFLWISSYIMTIILFLKQLKKYFYETIKLQIEKKLFKEILSYSYINFIGSSIAIFFTYTDTIMITIILNSLYTGYYNAVLPIASILLMTTLPLNILLYPRLSKLYHEKKNVYSELKQALTIITITNTLIFSLLYFNSKTIIYFLLGEKYLISEKALLILLIAFFINAYNQILHLLFSAKGYVKERLKVLSITLTLNIILNYMLIKKYDILGAAIATLTSFITMILLYLYFIQKKETKEEKKIMNKTIKTTTKYYITVLAMILILSNLYTKTNLFFSIKDFNIPKFQTNIILFLTKNILLILLITIITLIYYNKDIKNIISYIKKIFYKKE